MQVNYNTIPNMLFLPAIMVRDIRKASMIPMEEREPGEPDIILKSPLGFEDHTSRQELVNIFRYNNGKKIKLGAWKKGDGNMVVANSNDTMYAIYIPPSYELIIPTNNGARNLISKGVYLICASDGGGGIHRDSVYVLSPKFFRKMFCMSGSIQDNAEQCEELQRKIRKRQQQNLSENEPEQTVYKTLSFEEPDESYEDSYEEETDSSYSLKYEAIARIVKAGKNIGFLMVGLDGGEVRVTKKEILELARNNRISNIGIRIKDDKEYLYGIGMRLSELPEID